MGLIAMSERDLQRIEVLSKVIDGRMTIVSAAHVLGAEHASGAAAAGADQDGRRGVDPAQGERPAIEQSDQRRCSRLCGGARSRAICGFRSDAGGREAGRARWADGVARDVAQMDVGGWHLAVAQAAPDVPSAAAAARSLWRAGADRRFRASLVRGSWDPCSLLVFIDDATGKLMQLRFVRSESAFSYFEALELYLKASRRAGGVLFRQAFGVPGGEEGCQGRPGHDAVRPGALRAKHRDSLRKFEPGQGSCRADEPDAAGPAGQGAAAGGDLRHGGGQCLSAELHGALQCAVCIDPCPVR